MHKINVHVFCPTLSGIHLFAPGPKVNKIFMLNSAEHEIVPAGIITFMSKKNSILAYLSPKKKKLNFLIFLILLQVSL